MIIKPSKYFQGAEVLAGDSAPWKDYLDQLNWGPGNRDQSAWHAFLRAGSLGVDPDAATGEVTLRIRAAGGTFNPAKLQSQLRRAYEHAGREAGTLKALVKPPQTAFSPERLRDVAAAAPLVDERWLVQRSPVNPAAVSSAVFLDALYQPGEKIVAFTVFESQGQALYEVCSKANTPLPSGGPDGVWFLSNPVDGRYHANPRQENKLSRRSEESVTAWRYLVLESDAAPAGDWLRALVQLPLRIAAVYTSGGKSIHALVRLDAESKAQWDAQRDRIRPVVVTLGADPNALTAVRLTRLPGTYRGERPQQLLYVNPEPKALPILEL